MAKKSNLKVGSLAKIITGQDKGKTGKIIAINKNKNQIKVEGIKLMTHFDKKDGLKSLEGFIHISNAKSAK